MDRERWLILIGRAKGGCLSTAEAKEMTREFDRQWADNSKLKARLHNISVWLTFWIQKQPTDEGVLACLEWLRSEAEIG